MMNPIQQVLRMALILVVLICDNTSNIAWAHGSIHARMKLVNEWIQQTPNSANLYLNRGRLHQEHEDWDAALQDYDKALSLDSGLTELHYWKGLLYHDQGNHKLAKQYLKQFIDHNPKSSNGYRALGNSYRTTGDLLAAAEQYDIAIDKDPKPNPELFVLRAETLSEVKPLPHARIERGLNDAINLHGPLVSYILILIEINIQNGRYENALLQLARLPEKLRTTPKWELHKAQLIEQKGDTQQALNAYKKVIKLVEVLPRHRQQTTAIQTIKQKSLHALEGLQAEKPLP